MSRNNGPQRSDTLFPGRDIFAALELDPNERYVPIARLCASLGLVRSSQEKAIRTHQVLAQGLRMMELELENGHERQLCLRVDLLPLWLAGLDASKTDPSLATLLEIFQREVATSLWQLFRPQGFGPEDGLIPERHNQNPAEQAFVAEHAMATLARHQLLIENQLDRRGQDMRPDDEAYTARSDQHDAQADLLARAVRRVALAAQERTRRNEYPGMYTGLYRQFGISSYRRMPAGRLREALEWLERWRGDLMGEPEPPPDI